MINYYQNKCEKVLKQKHILYECTINLLRIIKKLPLLATVIKESLIAMIAFYNMRSNSKIEDYIMYNYLTRLQKVERNIFQDLPSQDNCEQILKNIKFIFNTMIVDIKTEIKGKTKTCLFKPGKIDPIPQDWKTVCKEDKKFFFKYLNKELSNEFKKIVIEKYHNLGFYFNTEIKMIDVSVPEEVNRYPNNNSNSTLYIHFVEKQKGKKSATEVAELLDFLEKALKDENLFDEEIKVTGLISDNSSGPSEPSNKKFKI
ncbi:uncharacterized protein LOC126910091 [Daktulosphaira vitifoliae]|uniref:uncharacterized protein LOC126910091 n=1 Tax=Daktulosphaira vitifoliae TaxID=58002 RepID=UPI0021A9F7CD|nr:uncharacterized protein LOC126910091 [Daktulosphaira vitifoliae]